MAKKGKYIKRVAITEAIDDRLDLYVEDFEIRKQVLVNRLLTEGLNGLDMAQDAGRVDMIRGHRKILKVEENEGE